MILDKKVKIKVAWSLRTYYSSLGYTIEKQKGKGINPEIFISIHHLKKNSNIRVKCLCESCFSIYDNRFSRNTTFCNNCLRKNRLFENDHGKKNKGKIILSMRGDSHPNWNPNKTQFQEYSSKVRILTEKNYENHKDILNPDNHRRTLCGVDGGYQLDHIKSIKYCFDNNISIEECSDIKNLQLLPWKANRSKGTSCVNISTNINKNKD